MAAHRPRTRAVASLFGAPLLAICLLAPPAAAQDTAAGADRDLLTAYLEDTFSDLGREVRITGFSGALSSRASLQQMTVADAQGVWLTLRDVTLDWNRSALFGGRVEVTEMSAGLIDVARRPVSDTGLPAAEAAGFSLPDLPVSVSIGRVTAAQVTLGPEILGRPVALRLEGSAELAGGAGQTDLEVTRTDGATGRLALSGRYDNADRRLSLDLQLAEGAGGIAATLAGLPGAPPVEMSVQGEGPIDDFAADLALATDGAQRLRGRVTLTAAEGAGADQPRARRFSLDVAGDVAPLFAPGYRDFFGTDIRLRASGQRRADGATDVDALSLEARAITLNGSLSLGPGGVPRRLALAGRIAANAAAGTGSPAGGPVRLPLPGTPTDVDEATLRLEYDAAQGDGWRAALTVAGLQRPDLRLGRATMTGSGRVRAPAGPAARGTAGAAARGTAIGGSFSFAALALEPQDAGLAAALGETVVGRLTFTAGDGDGLRISSLRLAGSDYTATLTGRLGALAGGLPFDGKLDLDAADMTRFAGLAGRPLAGGLRAQVTGSVIPLAGSFDLDGQITGQDLTLGNAQADALLRGTSSIMLSAARDTTGTTLRNLEVTAQSLRARATGRIDSRNGLIEATLDLADLAVLGGGYGGGLRTTARLEKTGPTLRLTAEGTARNLRPGAGEAAGRLLAGDTTLAIDATRTGKVLRVDRLDLKNPQLTLAASGSTDADGRIAISARLANLALLAPDFPGPLTVAGDLRRLAQGYGLALAVRGPGDTAATVTGRLAENAASGDLAFAGSAQAGLANPFIGPRSVQGPLRFDLRLNGPLALRSLSGTVTGSGLRVSDPDLGLALTAMTATARLASGRAEVTAQAAASTGGQAQLSGEVALAAPNDANLRIGLQSLRLRDGAIYDLRVSGALAVAGPLAGGARISGALRLDEAELRLPNASVAGAFQFPELRHLRDTPAIRLTRARAGLEGAAAGGGRAARSGGGAYPLDVSLTAPGRIFVRGRGLDAELGGTVQLGGTTGAIVASGGFQLVRGRLDILGRRFTLDEGSADLRGALVPYVRLSASSAADGITATVLIEGPADAPVISFTSSPPLPEEEVVSRLIFGRALDGLSPLQAAQLASAIATLSGRGGEGILEKLRRESGLDDLDVTTDSDGALALRLGKYLSDNLYTDVQLGAGGQSAISLNLDVTPSLTVRGRVGQAGQTGLGVFYERDY